MHKIILESAPELYAGERYIVVDGVRWGRTHVQHRSRYGTWHTFAQLGGEKIVIDPEARYPAEFKVVSSRRNPEHNPATLQTRLREAIDHLIEIGRLRHPDVIAAERAASREAFHKRNAERIEREEAEFRTRALAAVPMSLTTYLNDTLGRDEAKATLDTLQAAIVEAMRWAQTK